MRDKWADRILEILTRAMLSEISISPKPGLIDRGPHSAHRDMDFFSFVRSSAAIAPYFRRIFLLPFENKDCFNESRLIGMEAEKAMLSATGGANTQKGIIFLGGLLSLATGLLLSRKETLSEASLRFEISLLGKNLVSELEKDSAGSHGEALYRRYGATGIRGEVENGLPNVFEVGLPVLRASLEKNLSFNQAGIETLLSIMARCEDTTVLWRHGPEVLGEVRAIASDYLAKGGVAGDLQLDRLQTLDLSFSRRGISPGGSADLLFLSFAVHDLVELKKGAECSAPLSSTFG